MHASGRALTGGSDATVRVSNCGLDVTLQLLKFYGARISSVIDAVRMCLLHFISEARVLKATTHVIVDEQNLTRLPEIQTLVKRFAHVTVWLALMLRLPV